MSVSVILLIILFGLMTAVGGKRGIKSYVTLLFNFGVFFSILLLSAHGLNPLLVTMTGCLLSSIVTIFFIGGFSKKMTASLLSVMAVVVLTVCLTLWAGTSMNVQGFSNEQLESLSFLSLFIHLDFSSVVVCQMILGLLGAIIDVSVSISSSMQEIVRSHPEIPGRELIRAGMNIGKDILGTMTNTLLFAYIGGFASLMIWFVRYRYSLFDIVNSKVFSAEAFQILTSGIGVILIIPVTAAATAMFFRLSLFNVKDLIRKHILKQ